MWPFKKRITRQAPKPDPTPPLTERMQALGFHWRRIGNDWVEACNTCGGNCGQCGTSLGMGVPASMDCLIDSLESGKGVYGR